VAFYRFDHSAARPLRASVRPLEKTMRKGSTIFLLIICFAIITLADDLSFKNGRLNEGKVSILNIEKQQLITIKTKRVMVLSAAQKAVKKKETGVSPSVLEVYTVKGAEIGIHGCFAYNVAVWFNDKQVEVPHKYLISDQEAEKKANEFEEG
jgi:hypothetical protein